MIKKPRNLSLSKKHNIQDDAIKLFSQKRDKATAIQERFEKSYNWYLKCWDGI